MVHPASLNDLKGEAVMKDLFSTGKNVSPQEHSKSTQEGNNLLKRIIRLFLVDNGKNRDLIYDPYGSEIEKAWQDFEKGSKSH